MGVNVAVSTAVVSCVLMREGEAPLHFRIRLNEDDVIVERIRREDDAVISMPVEDRDLAWVLRQLPN